MQSVCLSVHVCECACEAQLIRLGRLFAELSVSQHCLIALLSGVSFFLFFFAPGLSAKKSSPRAGKRESKDHLPMVIWEWETEIEAVANM